MGTMLNGRGLGEHTLSEFLKDVPGFGKKIIEQQLANLKTSGIYARIMSEAEAEIAAEAR